MAGVGAHIGAPFRARKGALEKFWHSDLASASLRKGGAEQFVAATGWFHASAFGRGTMMGAVVSSLPRLLLTHWRCIGYSFLRLAMQGLAVTHFGVRQDGGH